MSCARRSRPYAGPSTAICRGRGGRWAGKPRKRTAVDDVLDDLRYSLARVYRDRSLVIEAGELEGQTFLGERDDLEEMLGNLMDDACKWAARRVVVEAASQGGRLLITVDDDGPGLPAERSEEALGRSARLDETTSGIGMGLAIVRDLVEAYGGSISLSTSPLGGLRATLSVPTMATGVPSDERR